ncbi:MAG: hypothetical protein H6606_08175 [Flavobacteriales bacterium]|nr:hypothetical protein [Flavobacteriales bacterium]
MLKYLVLCTFSVSFLISSAQVSDAVDGKSLKFYNLSTWSVNSTSSKDASGFTIENTRVDWQLVQPTLAFQWNTPRNTFHEIELTQLRFYGISNKSDRINDTTGHIEPVPMGSDMRIAEVSVRYEYNFYLNRSTSQKLIPSAGIGINPYFRLTDSSPRNSNSFPTRQTNSGAMFFLMPRLLYHISDKLFLDLNMPICLADSYLDVNKVENPLFTEGQQRTSSYNFQLFPQIVSGRLGIGLKL